MAIDDASWTWKDTQLTWSETPTSSTKPVVTLSSAYKPLSVVRNRGNNRNYKVLIAKGQDASNGYLRTGYTVIQPASVSGKAYYSDTPGFKSYQQFMSNDFTNWTGSFYSDTTLSDQALGRLKSRLANDLNQFQALIPLVEVRELRDLISRMADFTTSTVKTLIEIKKHPRNAFKHASDTWLGYAFGMAPMMSDAKSIAEAIAAYQLRKDHNNRYVGSASRSWISSPVVGHVSNGTNSYLLSKVANAREEVTLSYRYISAFHLLMESANNYSATDHFGFSFDKLPSVAWELTAFSWIADYFGTVGAYLDDVFTSPPGGTVYVVRDRKVNSKFTCDINVVSAGILHTFVEYVSNGKVSGEFFGFERVVQSSLPHRALRFKTIDEIGIHGVNKLLNLSALLLK